MNILRLAAAAVALFVLGLGQTKSGISGDPDVGQGPLHLTPAIADLYEKYKKEFIPYYFVVSTDGRSGNYVYCENACRPFGARTQALSGCEANSHGVPCKIFARRVDIVWEGQVTGLYNPETGSYDPRQSDNRIIALGLTLPQLIERAEQSKIAQSELGKAYEFGRGTPKDLDLAQRWYMKAAKGGHKIARFKIGWMYEEGLGGLPKDEAQAIYWYRQARPITGAVNALARLEPGSATETETALLTPPEQTNIPITEKEILESNKLKKKIEDYYDEIRIESTGRGNDVPLEIDRILEMRVLNISGNQAQLDIDYRASEGTYSKRGGAIVTVEKVGTKFHVLNMRLRSGN